MPNRNKSVGVPVCFVFVGRQWRRFVGVDKNVCERLMDGWREDLGWQLAVPEGTVADWQWALGRACQGGKKEGMLVDFHVLLHY